MSNNMDFEKYLQTSAEIGFVAGTNYPLVYINGLPGAHVGEKLFFENGEMGEVLQLDENSISVLFFSNNLPALDSKVVRTNEGIQIHIDDNIKGKIIDPLGKTLFGEPYIPETKDLYSIYMEAKGIAYRKNIKEPFLTGVVIVDLMIPLGKGQRQLIVGDKKIGKSSFALQIMLNQARAGIVCIYACIGKKKSEILSINNFFKKNNAMNNIVIIGTSSDDPQAKIYLAPYSAMRVAEYFRDQGKDTLLILDDMTTHARVYREISLLAKKFPGKESYPADIFYVHAGLLERAGCFEKGTITCLAISNTVEGDLSGYVQTNLMSMTDGHIFFDKEIFYQGHRPAVNHFLSVTRVGRQTQNTLRWSINRELSSFLNLYNKTKDFVHFGAELNEGIRATLNLGDKIMILFNQERYETRDLDLQIMLFSIIWSGLWRDKKSEEIPNLIKKVALNYEQNTEFKTYVKQIVASSSNFNALLGEFMKTSSKYNEYLF